MMKPLHRQQVRPAALAAAALGLLLAGCAGTAGAPPAPQADIPAQLPLAAAQSASAPAAAAPVAWRDAVRAPWLRALVELALANNRDLRVAVLNVERAQAQFTVTDSARLPTVGLGATRSRQPDDYGQQYNLYNAGVQISSWELDLFGRLKAGSDAAQASVLASEAGRRAAELSLAAQVVSGALALQADEALLALARTTLASREDTLRLTRLRSDVGAASALELQAQQTLVAQARASAAQLLRQRDQDRNALVLLLGRPLPEGALPAPDLDAENLLAEVPVGLSSAVLLKRPDVIQAEQTLAGAQANIAAARAALWPALTLTAQAGQASTQLSALFESGHFAYTLTGSLVATVFDGGRRQANIASAEASQRIALAQYEKAIQSAFRETADALAGVATWRDQLAAQREQLLAARETARLTELKVQRGAASELERLDAQRGLFGAEQSVLQTRLAELNNRVALFKALGG